MSTYREYATMLVLVAVVVFSGVRFVVPPGLAMVIAAATAAVVVAFDLLKVGLMTLQIFFHAQAIKADPKHRAAVFT